MNINNEDGKKYIIIDGPPFVSGNLHCGHAVVSGIKSTIFNYKNMHNNNCPFKLGYDTHGLPIEQLVCKENNWNTNLSNSIEMNTNLLYHLYQIKLLLKMKLRYQIPVQKINRIDWGNNLIYWQGDPIKSL